jgi:hypothetical protein
MKKIGILNGQNKKISMVRVRFLLLIKFTALLIILNINNCTKNSTEPQIDADKIDQKILFHFSYDNYAWGHNYSGWYIDNNGDIWNLKEVNHWWNEEMNVIMKENRINFYDYDSLNQSYEKCGDTVITKINLDSLCYYYKLINEASEGEYSEPINVGADMGSFIFGCLYYDKQKNKYKKIILGLDGDWMFKNLDSSAIKIDNWLKKINNEL